MKHIIFTLSFLFLTTAQAHALSLADLLTESPTLNPDIPTPEQIVGLGVGERHWFHHEIISYLDALAETSPRMQALGAHAQSYGGRNLVSYAISSPANLARLDEIKRARARIINADANVDLEQQPAVLHMMYSIHGNEPSGANATPLLSYYLTAAQSAQLDQQFKDVVIILNPMLNPDGLDRFAAWSNNHRGMTPSADAQDREHREAVPNGRTNYYWFDLNRDWLPHQHPESQGRLALFHEWKPNVQLDFHEQGSNSNFFFMPGKPERTFPLTPQINQNLTAKIGEFHSKAFDQKGTRYFTREGYDDFFVGKGSTYPDLFGCVGILFEQPSSRGAKQQTVNGLLTFEGSITNQFRASLSSLQGTATLKNELLAYQRDFYLNNKNKRKRGHYLATTSGDQTRLLEFIRVLRGHQIDVAQLAEDTSVNGQTFKAGQTIAIPADQTQATYLQAIWNTQLTFEENVFYDVSTWTLPLAFNLNHTSEPMRGITTAPLTTEFLTSSTQLPESGIGYLIDWRDSATPALLYDLLEAGANVRVATRPLTAKIKGRAPMSFGYGTLFVAPELGEAIPPEALALLQSAAIRGLPVYAAASSDTPVGIDLASCDFTVLALPKVLIASGPNTSAYRVGEIWHMLDRRVKMPLTMIDQHRLASLDLSGYTHLILTDALDDLRDSIVGKIETFVRNGGIVWAQGSTTLNWLNRQSLTDIIWRKTAAEETQAQLTQALTLGDTPARELETMLPERKPYADARDAAAFRLVRGAILKGLIDRSHPIGYGYTAETLPTFRRNAKFMARSGNAYATPVLYSNEPLLSGYMSDENRQLAAGSAGLIIDEQGQGAFVLALDIPTFRAFWWGTQRLLVNAIFFGALLDEPR